MGQSSCCEDLSLNPHISIKYVGVATVVCEGRQCGGGEGRQNLGAHWPFLYPFPNSSHSKVACAESGQEKGGGSNL